MCGMVFRVEISGITADRSFQLNTKKNPIRTGFHVVIRDYVWRDFMGAEDQLTVEINFGI